MIIEAEANLKSQMINLTSNTIITVDIKER